MDLDLHSCTGLLQTIKSHHGINQGRQLHLLLLKRGVLNTFITIGNRLLLMYTRCGYLADARKVFDEMTHKNPFTWNSMIEGFVKSGNMEESLGVFCSMPQRDSFSWNLVISGFVKAGELDIARRFFIGMPRRDGVALNSMINGYVRCGHPIEALKIFKDLSSESSGLSQMDMFVLASVIGACADLFALDGGKQIHARIVVDPVGLDSVLASSLVNMYVKCGDLESASQVLNLLPKPDDYSLSALISGYANCGRIGDAERTFHERSNQCVVLYNSMITAYNVSGNIFASLLLFNKMRKSGVQEDSSTVVSVLSACSSLGILELGKQMHAHACKLGVKNDLIVATALMDMYAKCGWPNNACELFCELKTHDTIVLNLMITIYCNCGKIEDAKQIFRTMPARSLISWNSMIVGLSQNGHPIEALILFCKMNKMALRMDKFSLASVISTCASISSLQLGEQIFARANILGLESDQIVATSLIDFYCKCGFVLRGRRIFDKMEKSDDVSWNTMLMGYATNGHGFETLNLFYEMRSASILPTDVTFTAVLSACDHCGIVEEGWKWFNAMKHDYHIDPGIEHYSCMIDLFARVGRLEEAISLIKEMPFDADASMWSSVLRGCVAHGDTVLGEKVADLIKMIEPDNADAYVQLSSMFASCGDWERSTNVRKLMREKRIQKNPGQSWA